MKTLALLVVVLLAMPSFAASKKAKREAATEPTKSEAAAKKNIEKPKVKFPETLGNEANQDDEDFAKAQRERQDREENRITELLNGSPEQGK